MLMPINYNLNELQIITNACGVTCSLHQHQLEAILWWLHQEGLTPECRKESGGGLVADDMGLGKTVTAIVASVLGRYYGSEKTPTLIVCPKALLSQWKNEVHSKTTLVEDDTFTLTAGTKNFSPTLVEKCTFIFTTYNTVRQAYKTKNHFYNCLYKTLWSRVVLDEAIAIKNSKTLLFKSIQSLQSTKRFAMTGTPISNQLQDLSSLAFFIGVYPYSTQLWWKHCSMKSLKQWKSKYTLRRLKEDIVKLPYVHKKDIVVSLSEKEMSFYNTLAVNAIADYKDYVSTPTEKRSFHTLLVWLLKLRQCTCDPALVHLHSIHDATIASSKTLALVEYIKKESTHRKKMIVLSQWSSYLTIVQKTLQEHLIHMVRMDGSIGSSVEREKVLKTFKNDPNCTVLLGTTGCVATGLDLTCAQEVILLDLSYNPIVETQAFSRVHRLGQTCDVYFTRFFTNASVDSATLEMQKHKTLLATTLLDGKNIENTTILEKQVQSFFHEIIASKTKNNCNYD